MIIGMILSHNKTRITSHSLLLQLTYVVLLHLYPHPIFLVHIQIHCGFPFAGEHHTRSRRVFDIKGAFRTIIAVAPFAWDSGARRDSSFTQAGVDARADV